MNAVGIDVSKGKSMVAVLRPFGEVVTLPYSVSHTASELSELANSLKSLDGEVRVIMEYTGRYYEPVAKALHEAGIFVSVVNPLLINQYGNNSVRKVKTDKADAVKIAKYGLDNWAELREYDPMDTTRQNLLLVCRQYNLYMKNKTAFKSNLIALLDQTFPTVHKLFKSPVRDDGSQKWVDFATTFWHCECVCGVSEKAFTERYRKWCKRHRYIFSPRKASEIYAAASEQVPTLPKDNHIKLLVTEAITQLNAISRTVEALRSDMQSLAQSLPEYPVVAALYGAGDTTAAQLIAEIGDVRRFKSKQALSAFAGVDPSPNQSGTREAKSTSITKRGRAPLRKTLFQIMECHLKRAPHDEPVFQFLDKKRAEGKPYYVYMTAGANKFLRIYYGRVREYLNALDSGDES
ncbi:IS110 family RNA-guided transposase [Christensenella hongkongensis]|jgi:transposase|uniref:Mobile element protein n=1 Tax=Christensenella hongkongensis TaxID=270498 RepID=A0A0M2NH84_9FIRM|nr:IS110 family transposase [Christensenella hongkongensis]KKI51924.1 Mobile element protein [Christensenella hongkongensis]TCW24524.1 transposase IS116/IS110/IS902 family protein [Christensenella hongkongensis]